MRPSSTPLVCTGPKPRLPSKPLLFPCLTPHPLYFQRRGSLPPGKGLAAMPTLLLLAAAAFALSSAQDDVHAYSVTSQAPIVTPSYPLPNPPYYNSDQMTWVYLGFPSETPTVSSNHWLHNR